MCFAGSRAPRWCRLRFARRQWPLQSRPAPASRPPTSAAPALQIYTYRPDCPDPSLLLVFHGLNRNADRYRDYARSLGDRLCMLVVAPKFDKERFPTWRYQRGGIVDSRGVVQPPATWTGRLVMELVAWLRTQEGRPLAYSMIGHSAGGQFLSRLVGVHSQRGAADGRRQSIDLGLSQYQDRCAVRAWPGLSGRGGAKAVYANISPRP